MAVELLDIMDEQIEDLEETEKESWKIENDIQADWWMEKKNEEKAKKEKLRDSIKSKILFYENQLKKVDDEIDIIEEFKNFKLEEYFNSLDKNSYIETKTMKKYELPTGTLIMKKQNPEFKRDNDKLISWLKDNEMNDYIKISESAQWGELKKIADEINGQVVIKETGEIIEGVEVKEKPDIFEIKER